MSLFIFNFKKLPNGCLVAILLCIITIISGAVFLTLTDNMPAPMFSSRISLDEKFRFLRFKGNYQADFIVLGSSTGLNNISSKVMMGNPEIGQNYLNYTAWGLTIPSKLYFWSFIKQIMSPKVVIIPIDLNEFHRTYETPEFNQKEVIRYLDGAFPVWIYIKNHKKGFVERIGKVLRHRRMNDTQISLKYDEGGSVPLNVKEKSEDLKVRWKDGFSAKYYHEESYAELEQLLSDMEQIGIVAIVVQQPLREHYSEKEPKMTFVKNHWDKVKEISQASSAYFFNLQDVIPADDRLFSDSGHLQWKAAEEFTTILLERMEQAGVFDAVDGNESGTGK